VIKKAAKAGKEEKIRRKVKRKARRKLVSRRL
jgi:hypothetical protein